MGLADGLLSAGQVAFRQKAERFPRVETHCPLRPVRAGQTLVPHPAVGLERPPGTDQFQRDPVCRELWNTSLEHGIHFRSGPCAVRNAGEIALDSCGFTAGGSICCGLTTCCTWSGPLCFDTEPGWVPRRPSTNTAASCTEYFPSGVDFFGGLELQRAQFCSWWWWIFFSV